MKGLRSEGGVVLKSERSAPSVGRSPPTWLRHLGRPRYPQLLEDTRVLKHGTVPIIEEPEKAPTISSWAEGLAWFLQVRCTAVPCRFERRAVERTLPKG